MGAKAELVLSALSTVLSAAAVAVSIYSYAQVEAQVRQGEQQVALAREALRSGERNAAFLDFTTKLTGLCKALDLSGGRNGFSYATTDAADGVSIIASYQANYSIPAAETAALISKVVTNLQAVADAQYPLKIWLEEERYQALSQAAYDLQSTMYRELLNPVPATLRPDRYHALQALCAGTRDVLVDWYRDPSANRRFPNLESVRLTTRSP